MSKIGIVTVLYKSEAVLEDFFLSIASQTHSNYLLYIVDNSPSIESELLIKKYCEQYQITNKTTYLPSKGNIGVAAGNNVGINAALKENCDAVILSNNDIVFDNTNLFKFLTIEFEKGNEIIIPKIYYSESNKIWFIDGSIDIWRANVTHFYDRVEDKGQFVNIKTTEYSPTCFMLIGKKVFDEIGLMDEKYFVYFDDVDFVYRFNNKGFFITVMENLSIEHKVSHSTGGGFSDFSFQQILKNRKYFIEKHYTNFFIKYSSLSYLFLSQIFRAIQHKKKNYFLTHGLTTSSNNLKNKKTDFSKEYLQVFNSN